MVKPVCTSGPPTILGAVGSPRHRRQPCPVSLQAPHSSLTYSLGATPQGVLTRYPRMLGVCVSASSMGWGSEGAGSQRGSCLTKYHCWRLGTPPASDREVCPGCGTRGPCLAKGWKRWGTGKPSLLEAGVREATPLPPAREPGRHHQHSLPEFSLVPHGPGRYWQVCFSRCCFCPCQLT